MDGKPHAQSLRLGCQTAPSTAEKTILRSDKSLRTTQLRLLSPNTSRGFHGSVGTPWQSTLIGHRSMGVDRDQGAIPIDIIIHGLQVGFHFIL
jgi:hypothetical protein